MWTKFIVHLGAGRMHSMKSKSHRYFLPSPWGTQTSHCDSDWWVVTSHGSRVTRVTGQLTDGSRGSWVIKCDPLSALLRIRYGGKAANQLPIVFLPPDDIASCGFVSISWASCYRASACIACRSRYCFSNSVRLSVCLSVSVTSWYCI